MTRQYSRLHKAQDRRSEARNVQPRTPPPCSNRPLHCIPRSLATHIRHTLSHTHTHAFGHTLRMPFSRWGCECERDKNQHSATPAALPAELMHSQRSSRLNESVVGFALLSLAHTAAAPIHTAGVKIVDTRILTKESMSIYYSIRKYSTYVNSI